MKVCGAGKQKMLRGQWRDEEGIEVANKARQEGTEIRE